MVVKLLRPLNLYSKGIQRIQLLLYVPSVIVGIKIFDLIDRRNTIIVVPIHYFKNVGSR